MKLRIYYDDGKVEVIYNAHNIDAYDPDTLTIVYTDVKDATFKCRKIPAANVSKIMISEANV
mgnify:CR=1 FL=1